MNTNTFTIKIDLSNAAFDGYCGEEISRILRCLADKLEYATSGNPADNAGRNIGLTDINGNRVGNAKFK